MSTGAWVSVGMAVMFIAMIRFALLSKQSSHKQHGDAMNPDPASNWLSSSDPCLPAEDDGSDSGKGEEGDSDSDGGNDGGDGDDSGDSD